MKEDWNRGCHPSKVVPEIGGSAGAIKMTPCWVILTISISMYDIDILM